MIMEVLVLDGKNYVKASKAADSLGYASDYVGQLCRSGKVDAHLIGRTWYVNQDELTTHRVEKKRMSRVKAREHARKSIEEHRLKIQETQNNYKNIDIQYEKDNEPLIPKARKLDVFSIVSRGQEDEVEESDIGDEREILNKGDKVLMSGDLTVVDVTDGSVDSDTVFLTPGKIKKTRQEKKEIKNSIEESTFEEEILKTEDSGPTFIDRLEEKTVVLPVAEAEVGEITVNVTDNTPDTPLKQKRKISWAYYIIVFLLLSACSLSSTALYRTISYTSARSHEVDESIRFSQHKLISEIRSKI